MLEKRIVYKVPSEVRKQSIETLKVRKTTLEYLRQNGFKTVEDITIDHKIPLACGGADSVENLHICCLEDNLFKGSCKIKRDAC